MSTTYSTSHDTHGHHCNPLARFLDYVRCYSLLHFSAFHSVPLVLPPILRLLLSLPVQVLQDSFLHNVISKSLAEEEELVDDGTLSQRIIIYESKQVPALQEVTLTSQLPPYDSVFGFGIGERSRALLSKTTYGTQLENAIEEVAAKSAAGLWLVNRDELCQVLTDHLQRTFGRRIQIIYGTQVLEKETNENGQHCSKIRSLQQNSNNSDRGWT